MKGKLAAIYVRRSLERTGEDSVSISQQLADANKLAKGEGCRVDDRHTYIDANLSGKLPPTCWAQGKSKSRPALSKLIDDIEKGEPVVVVICRKRDRLARNLVLAMRLYEFFAEHKVRLLCTHESLPASTDASGKFTLAVLAAAAELTLQQISENYLATKKYMKSEGRKIGPSYCLGYYELGNGKVKVDEAEAEIVREVFRRFAGGAGKLALVRFLNEHHRDKRKKKGRRWWSSSVDRLLTNVRYIGLQQYGDGSLVKSAAYPPIVDAALFHQVQQLFKARRGMRPRFEKHPHLLSGFLRCGDCGRPLRARTVLNKQKKVVGMTYLCTNSEHQHNFKPFQMMEAQWIEWFDRFSSAFIHSLFHLSDNKEKQEESQIKARLAKIEENLERVAAQVARGETDADVLVGINRRAREERLKLEGTLATMVRGQSGFQTFVAWGGMNFQQKRIALTSAVDRIDVFEREVVVHLLSGRSIQFPLMARRQLDCWTPSGQLCLTPPRHIREQAVIDLKTNRMNWKPYVQQGYFWPVNETALSKGASKTLDLTRMWQPFDETELDDVITKEIGKGWIKRRDGNVVTWIKGDVRRTAVVDPRVRTRRLSAKREKIDDRIWADHKKNRTENEITYTSPDGRKKITALLRQPLSPKDYYNRYFTALTRKRLSGD
ncbi:MAG TPA: recombinase family protein [Verrucomicrobiae bacterium]|nr:recombinase family protein [Verrucomicrobiae bacterium]